MVGLTLFNILIQIKFNKSSNDFKHKSDINDELQCSKYAISKNLFQQHLNNLNILI